MEIVYFGLGVVTVLLILGVVVIVKVSKTITNIVERIGSAEQQINMVEESVNRRVDNTEMSLHSTIREIEVDIKSQLDSRIDKLTSQIIKQKDLLKG
jgi:vacuolar-type H+-ATPase subunit H